MLRMKELRKAAKKTQEEVAREVGISRTQYNRIENGRSWTDKKIFEKIAKAVNVKFEELFTDQPHDLPEGAMPIRKVPLLSWIKAGEWTDFSDMDFPSGYAEEYIETTAKGKRVFALRVHGDSMSPEFQDGEIIVVDPEQEVQHGQYGVVKNLETNETTLKRIEFYDNMVILRPLNPAYNPIEIKDGQKHIRIIGKVVRKEKSY